ncbi:MAG: hypothetical protein AB7N80_07905 [Bdellovibrionales bacterium]
MRRFWALLFLLIAAPVWGLELQGVVTDKCRVIVGLPINVDSEVLTLLDLDGRAVSISRVDVDSVAIYNVLENPFGSLSINEKSLSYLRELYLDDGEKPDSLVFAVRFIEDLVIFMSLDGQSHVHSQKDIDRLRPASTQNLGVRRLNRGKHLRFSFPEGSERCPGLVGAVEFVSEEDKAQREISSQKKSAKTKAKSSAQKSVSLKSVPPGEDIPYTGGVEAVRPTRVLSDKISISELYDSFARGYDALDSFQERTYLYAKPFLYPKESRLGLILANSKKEEAGLQFPIYFQWSSGEPYRFQSFNVFGGKPNEFLPNAEPVFAIRSDVKSHVFHGLFVGNIMGMPAGESIFLEGATADILKKSVTVQPSYNYLAMMGGDYGPYSLSVGFFYPTFGIRVGNQQREVLGSSLTYAVRAMYTTRRFRLRAITSLTEYDRNQASKEDVLVMVNGQEDTSPSSFEFRSFFLRPGVDYNFTDELKVGADFILVDGSYKEVRGGLGSDIGFRRMTTQFSVQQSFGDYITLIGYVDLLRHAYDANFAGEAGGDKELTETKFFGTLEFVF